MTPSSTVFHSGGFFMSVFLKQVFIKCGNFYPINVFDDLQTDDQSFLADGVFTGLFLWEIVFQELLNVGFLETKPFLRQKRFLRRYQSEIFDNGENPEIFNWCVFAPWSDEDRIFIKSHPEFFRSKTFCRGVFEAQRLTVEHPDFYLYNPKQQIQIYSSGFFICIGAFTFAPFC